jgi:hypothetical protein
MEKKNYYNPDDTVIQPPDTVCDPELLILQNSVGKNLNGFFVIYKESWIEESAIKSNSYLVFIEDGRRYTAKATDSNLQEQGL